MLSEELEVHKQEVEQITQTEAAMAYEVIPRQVEEIIVVVIVPEIITREAEAVLLEIITLEVDRVAIEAVLGLLLLREAEVVAELRHLRQEVHQDQQPPEVVQDVQVEDKN